jgi:serine/threonine-protein kinase
LCRQIAEGLEAAHDAGIVHRDLKPTNVKITPGGGVKLLDFGLAKTLAASGSEIEATAPTATVTREGAILGTLPYMSPEQARGQPTDRRTDIWAFGCCLYECLSGRRAFDGESASDTVAAILDKEPDWSALRHTVPQTVLRLLRRCLAKDVSRRLQHIGDARLELEEFQADEAQRSTPTLRPFQVGRAVASGALLIALGAGLAYWLGGRRTMPLTNRSIAQLTVSLQSGAGSNPGLAVSRFFIPFALSHDGERLVFRSRAVKTSQLILRELSGTEMRVLPGTDLATTPFFSPDGRWVGFWRAEDGILRKVSIAGGAPIAIGFTDAPRSAIWVTDEEIVFETDSSPKGELWSIPASGGKPQQIVVRDRVEGERVSLRAQVPSGGDLLVASIGPVGTWLDVLSRTSGRRRRLLKGGSDVGAWYTQTRHLVYSDGDALFAVPLNEQFEPVGAAAPVMHGIDHYRWHANVALSDTGTVVYLPSESVREPQLLWLDFQGNITPVPGGGAEVTSVALSPDGREVASDIVEGTRSQVWISDVQRGTRRLLVSEGDSSYPIWDRHGKFITYASRRGQHDALYRRRSDGTGAEELLVLSPGAYPRPQDWSPDGRSLLFTAFTDRGDANVWIYSEGRTTPLLQSLFNESSATFSPDGRFVAFDTDEGGEDHVYVQPFPGNGPRTAVSAEEGYSPRWGPDGRQIFYFSRRRIMAVAVQTTQTLRVGEPQLLLKPDQIFRTIDTRDGRRFLTVSERTVESPLELGVVLNWFEELERLAPHLQR